MKSSHLLGIGLLILSSSIQALEPTILRHEDTLYVRIQLLNKSICYAGKIWEITQNYPRDWKPLAEVLREHERPLDYKETMVCLGGLRWRVAPNIYRGRALPDRPASYYGKKGGARIEVGQPCFEYIAEARGENRQYRIAYLPGGDKVVTICESYITAKEIQQ